MNKEELEKKFGVTEQQLDALAAPFEEGRWPEGRTVLIGRPRLAEEEVRPVTFKLPVSQIAALDRLAEKAGCTRSEALREAVRRELAAAS